MAEMDKRIAARMPRSMDRILTTHVGSLPRTPAVADLHHAVAMHSHVGLPRSAGACAVEHGAVAQQQVDGHQPAPARARIWPRKTSVAASSKLPRSITTP